MIIDCPYFDFSKAFPYHYALMKEYEQRLISYGYSFWIRDTEHWYDNLRWGINGPDERLKEIEPIMNEFVTEFYSTCEKCGERYIENRVFGSTFGGCFPDEHLICPLCRAKDEFCKKTGVEIKRFLQIYFDSIINEEQSVIDYLKTRKIMYRTDGNLIDYCDMGDIHIKNNVYYCIAQTPQDHTEKKSAYQEHVREGYAAIHIEPLAYDTLLRDIFGNPIYSSHSGWLLYEGRIIYFDASTLNAIQIPHETCPMLIKSDKESGDCYIDIDVNQMSADEFEICQKIAQSGGKAEDVNNFLLRNKKPKSFLSRILKTPIIILMSILSSIIAMCGCGSNNSLSEEEASQLVIQAWNSQDTSLLSTVLHEDFVYNSVSKTQTLGKQSYLEYLAGKFNTFNQHGIHIEASLHLIDNKPCVRIHSDYESKDGLLVFEIKDGCISKMLMRPEVVYTLADLSDPVLSDTIIQKIEEKINTSIPQKVEKGGLSLDQFEWIQRNVYLKTPQFQHLCFRVGQAVYSARIIIYGQGDDAFALGNVVEDTHLEICEANDMIPCVIGIDVNALNEPTLLDARTFEEIDIVNSSQQGGGILSAWEINHYGVYCVLNHLLSLGATDLEFTDAPGFIPQIFFTINNQKRYVYVESHPSGVSPNKINKSLCDSQPSSLTGYYADVKLSFLSGNNGDFKDTIIPRGSQIVWGISGIDKYNILMPIEEAYETIGYFQGDSYSLNYQ